MAGLILLSFQGRLHYNDSLFFSSPSLTRFPAPRPGDNGRGFPRRVLDDLEGQATRAWDPPSGEGAIIALDFTHVLVPLPESSPGASSSGSASVSTSPYGMLHPTTPLLSQSAMSLVSYHAEETAGTSTSVFLDDNEEHNQDFSSTIDFGGGFEISDPVQATGQP